MFTRISDPTTATKEEGEKTCPTFFVCFEKVKKKKIRANLLTSIVPFTQNIVTALKNMD
jgi:hypothetical protein